MIEVVNQNYSFVEPFATIVDDTFLRITCRIDSDMDPYGQQENDEVTENIFQIILIQTLWKQQGLGQQI